MCVSVYVCLPLDMPSRPPIRKLLRELIACKKRIEIIKTRTFTLAEYRELITLHQ